MGYRARKQCDNPKPPRRTPPPLRSRSGRSASGAVGVATRGTPITGARLYTLQKLYMTRVHVLTRTVDRHGSRARPTNFHRGW